MFLKNKNLFYLIPIILIIPLLVYCVERKSFKTNNIVNLGVVYPNGSFSSIVSTENGDIYYGGFPSDKLFSFNLYNQQISPVANLEKHGSIQSLFYTNNKLFIGGYGDGGNLYEYSLADKVIRNLNLPEISNYIGDIIGNKNFIYGTTSGGKLFSYNQTTEAFNIYDLPEKKFAHLSALSDGTIIGGTTINATIFSYNLEKNLVEKLYKFDDDIAIAKLITDKNDIVYGSTSPGNKIFNFDYKTKNLKLFIISTMRIIKYYSIKIIHLIKNIQK